MAYRYDIILDQGSDVRQPIEFYDSGNRPIAFNGFAARMQVRRTPSSQAVIDELTSEKKDGKAPRITFSANVCTLHFPRAVTQEIKQGRYCFDLEVTAPNGDVTRLLEGAFVIRPEVTR